MAEVTGYSVQDFGFSDDSRDSRAEIQLTNGSTELGSIKFHDPGTPFHNDTISSTGSITMHLPSAMFDRVLDVLRNEKPVHLDFTRGRAVLTTASEPVGESEPAGESETDLPTTRAPVFVEWRSYNYFVVWKNDPPFFNQELTAYPPVMLYAEGGFGGHVENPFQWGAVKGIPNPDEPNADVYGNKFTPHPNAIYKEGRPDPETLELRFSELPKYLAAYEGITRPAPYIDLGTQIYGSWLKRTGFWDFYDHWDEYALPTPDNPNASGNFDLGPKPQDDPIKWLRKWHDPQHSSSYPACQFIKWADFRPTELPPFPDPQSREPIEKQLLKLFDEEAIKMQVFAEELLRSTEGFSFSYSPAQLRDDSYFRFSVCLNTKGWAMWWKQIMQWLARVGFRTAFIDNTAFNSCWNAECQAGYRAWLAKNYSRDEIERFFTVSSSLLADHSFENLWFQTEENGPWLAGNTNVVDARIFPDVDSFDGLYSLRMEGRGLLKMSYPLFGELPPLEAKDYSLTIHYKTGGDIGASLHVQHFGPGNPVVINESLSATPDWTAFNVTFHIPAGVGFEVFFAVERPGNLWLDDIWLSHVEVHRGETRLDHPTFKTELWSTTINLTSFPDQLRQWAALTYWDSVVDEKLVYLREMAREIAPDFQLFTNSYRQRQAADYFLVEGQCFDFERSRQDAGHTPGVYRPARAGEQTKKLRERDVVVEILNTNIFDYKYTYSKRRTDSFAYHVHNFVNTTATDEKTQNPFIQYPHNLASAMLVHAEAAAFGAGAGVDMQLRLPVDPYTADERTNLRNLSRQFFQFVGEHRDAFEGLRSYGEVGIVYHGIRFGIDYHNQIFDLALGLAGRGVLWDLLTEERCTAANFARYKVLICHDVEQMSETVAQALLDFMQRGGLVIASGNEVGSLDSQRRFNRFYVGMLDELFRMRAANPNTVWPPAHLGGDTTETHEIGQGRLISMPVGAPAVEQLIQLIEDFFADKGRPRRLGVFAKLSPTELERMRVAAWTNPDRLALHLVNYNVPLGKENGDQVARLRNVEVKMVLPQNLTPSSVRLLKPEEAAAAPLEVESDVSKGVLSFVVPSLHVYEIAMIQ